MAKVVKSLRKLGIDIILIPDIDVINDENIFRDIVQSFDINWPTIYRG